VASVTVAPGVHRVAVRRAGYASMEQSITLQDGALGNLNFAPAVDAATLSQHGGILNVQVSENQSVVSVDDSEAAPLVNPVHLPAGPHRIRIERGGFLPAERDTYVPLGSTANVVVALKPTPDTRVQYVTSAERHRAWSWVTLGTGVALGAAGTVMGLVEQGKLSAARRAATGCREPRR